MFISVIKREEKSGGITNEGEKLLNPIKKNLNTNVPVKISTLQNDAGIVGAAHINVM